MTTDYELHQMFDILNKVQRRVANFGNTPSQRSRANENESARFEASGGTVGRKRQGAMNVANPSKTRKIEQKKPKAKPKTPKTPDTPATPVAPTGATPTIDGSYTKPKTVKQKKPKTTKTKKPKAKPMSRIDYSTGTSQAGVDPSGSRARSIAVPSGKKQERENKQRRAAARKLSQGASDAQTYAARKLQNQLGVRGVGRPKKVVEKPKTKKTKKKKITTGKEAIKTACPLVKAELNGAFNNLLDQYQVLYD